MDSDALRPVILGSAAVIILTSFLSGAFEYGLELPVVYAEAVSNGGMALVLIGILMLFETLSYARYRKKGLLRIGVDAALVFLAATVVTLAVISGFDAVGLGELGGEVAGVTFEAPGVIGGIAAFGAAAALFYARNSDCYQPTRFNRRASG
jgi:hypothetical protein